MLTFQQINHPKDSLYPFMESLLVASFPPEEYRALEELRKYTVEEPRFHNNIIKDGEENIGLLTYWKFDDFYYAEHFAIDPSLRNRKYGEKALTSLSEQLDAPIVLEVEIPDNEMAQRRIGFYERNGFQLWKYPYRQPPYKKGDEYLPMLLMVKGNQPNEADFEKYKATIYQHVYGVQLS